MGLKKSYLLIIFFVIFLFLPHCVGVQFYPLRDGEYIQLEFAGPVQVTYYLSGDTEVSYTVADSDELILANLYDDGDDGTYSLGERFHTYFRLNPDGGDLHLGMDPEVKELSSDDLEFPDPIQRAQYLNTAQFHLLGEGGLVAQEAINLKGELIRAKAVRWKTYCVIPIGEILFEVDFQDVQLCNAPNEIVISEQTQDYHYTREEIEAMIAGNQRSMLQAAAGPATEDRPPLVLKIVNIQVPTEEDSGPDPALDGEDANETFPNNPVPRGGCSLIKF